MRADVSTIAAGIAADITGAPQTVAARIRFKLEFAILMLTAGRTDEAADAFGAVFKLIDQIDA